MAVTVYRPKPLDERVDESLRLDLDLVEGWLVAFLQHEVAGRIGARKAVIGLSGGVDSAVSALLCVQAFGAENVHAFKMPYRTSSPESAAHADLLIEEYGLPSRTIDISDMVDGYAGGEEMTATRLGNVCARCRTTILFDQSAALGGIPIGTGNKTERLMGYFTWHADDAPPVNPLGDLYKTQVWALARHLGVPEQIVSKPPTADLVQGQTDEGDFGVDYATADRILALYVRGWSRAELSKEFEEENVRSVCDRVDGTHWKRHMPVVAMMSDTAIEQYYLRPVDYRG